MIGDAEGKAPSGRDASGGLPDDDVVLSVIIPCRNSEATIGEQLAALSRQEWDRPWEVVVADNGSGDGTRGVVRGWRDRLPGLRLVDASDVRGPAHARNVGAAHARGHHLAFCDADDVVGEGWVAAMAEGLAEHEFVASRYEYRRINPEWLIRARGEAQSDGIQTLWYPPHLPHAGGGGLGIRKSLHEAVGGFDEGLTRLQDTDYCIRVQLRGARLVFLPEAVVHVRHKEDSSGIFGQASGWARYNSLMFRRYAAGDTDAFDRPWRRYLASWRRHLAKLPKLRDRKRRLLWVYRTGHLVGLLQAALAYGMPPMIEKALPPREDEEGRKT